MKTTTATTTLFYTRPATIAEKIKGVLWRIKFRALRHLADGWEWAQATETDSRVKKITTEVRYE